MTYEGLLDAYLSDLNPVSSNETSLAYNLVTLEWESIRHRNMRDDLIRAEYRKIAVGAFATHSVGGFVLGEGSDEVQASVNALLGTKTDAQKLAFENWSQPEWNRARFWRPPMQVRVHCWRFTNANLPTLNRAAGTCAPNLTD